MHIVQYRALSLVILDMDIASQDNGTSSLAFDNVKLFRNALQMYTNCTIWPNLVQECVYIRSMPSGSGGYVAMLVAGSLGSSRLVL